MYLYNFYSQIPYSIVYKILKELMLINENNKYDLVMFEEQKEVEFFKNIEYILDCKEVKNLSYEDKENLSAKILNKANEIEKEMKKVTFGGPNYRALTNQWELYNHMYYSLHYISIDDNKIREINKIKVKNNSNI